MNWLDWAIMAFLAAAGLWGFRHGALRLLVLGVIMALGLSLGDFFFRAILGLVRGFFSDAAESTLETVALFGAIIGGAIILWIAWGQISRIPVGISVSRLLGALFGLSIGFLLLSTVIGLRIHETAGLLEERYPGVHRMIDEAKLVPTLTGSYESVIEGVIIPDNWSR